MTGCSTPRTSARSRRSSCRTSPRCPTRNARSSAPLCERGGSLIATYETSLYDEWGVQRNDFGLADLFGVTFKGRIEGPMQNSYLRLETDPATGKRHPLLAGLEDAPRIINGVRRVEVEATRPFPNPPLTLIPSYPDLPMEKVYPRVLKTDCRRFTCANWAPGRVVYFPWDIDRTFWEVLSRGPLQAAAQRRHCGPRTKTRPSPSPGPGSWTSPSGDRRTRSPFIWST